MTQNVAARLDTKTNKCMCVVSVTSSPFFLSPYSSIADFPPGLFRQLTTCQTAANEFLRQFWTSIYPSPADLPTPTSTSAQRSAKAAKMAGYLGKTHEKVDALVRAAVMEGVEGNRVVVVSGCLPSSFTHLFCIPLVTSAIFNLRRDTGHETSDGCSGARASVSSCEERGRGKRGFSRETWWSQTHMSVTCVGARMGWLWLSSHRSSTSSRAYLCSR